MEKTVREKVAEGYYGYEDQEKFETDLLKEHGVTHNPKASKAFAIAWELGHSYGYLEVVSYFEDIVELIK